jgi:proline racemase
LVSKHLMLPIKLYNVGTLPQLAGRVQGEIYLTTTGYGTVADEVVYGGNSYFIFTNGSTQRLAVAKF